MSFVSRHIKDQYCPQYRAVLTRAVGAGYQLPSHACKSLQDRMVRELVDASFWNRLDFLHLYAHDSGNADMARINYSQPSKNLSTGSPTYVHKKGIYGTIAHSFDVAADKIAMGEGGSNFCSEIVWLTENGSTISTVESLMVLNGLAAGNARVHTIRLRTNPRVDYLLNTTVAGVQVIYNGFPLDNHCYHIEIGNDGAGIYSANYVNGVNTFFLQPTATGSIPDVGTLSTSNITSTRAVGLIAGGGSMKSAGSHANGATLYNIFKRYMDGLAALP